MILHTVEYIFSSVMFKKTFEVLYYVAIAYQYWMIMFHHHIYRAVTIIIVR